MIKEDPKNENILYVGTDHGLYISLNRGQSFIFMDNNLPAVPVHDLVIHPRENELIVGTHGRSLYRADVSELQQLDEVLLAKNLHLFELRAPRYSSRWGRVSMRGNTTPQMEIPVYAKTGGTAELVIQTPGDKPLSLHTFEAHLNEGLNYISYDLSLKEDQMKPYKTFLNKKIKADEKPISLKKADNGSIYLKPGTYHLKGEIRRVDFAEGI